LLVSVLGDYFRKEYTDWSVVEREFAYFEKVISYFGPNPISTQTKNHLLNGTINLDDIRIPFENINTILDGGFLLLLNQNFRFIDNADAIPLDSLNQLLESTTINLKTLNSGIIRIRPYRKTDLGFADLINSLGRLEKFQAITKYIENEEGNLRASYKFYFKGANTNWNSLLNYLSWTGDFKKLIVKHKLSRQYVERICTDEDSIKYAFVQLGEIRRSVNDLERAWKWYLSLFEDVEDFYCVNFDALVTRIEKCLDNLTALEEWIDYRTSREKCKNVGLEDFLQKIEQGKLESNLILPTFLKRFYRLWLDTILPDYPAVATFRKRSQETTIKEFGKLDLFQIKIAQKRVQERLVSKLPDVNRLTSAVDEVAILRRELSKQRKIMPLRKLFRAIPHLLLTLKPCFMMSPLSVSLFLEDLNYAFDVVIFDEASQVCTEDAIGAIMRGTQVVIAGDSKQLPPTSFFSTTTSDNDFDTDDFAEDEYDDTDAYESILDEAVTVLPQSSLRWHYRSRHEHLIAFSNTKIYKNSLITFPSPIEHVKDNGVEYIYVPDGVYDRSGKRINVIEAKRVADIVFEQIEKYPQRSLGVVTFSEAQQQAIEGAIRQRRLMNQHLENYFNEEKDDAFFVKNLENVQGDERDTIIISIGYAKDQNGVMYMNFGPLIKSGGYRRLNVAITRAKYNVKLVGSIQPTDIRVENTSSEGVKMLRSYIEFAKAGPSIFGKEIIVSETINNESPFEEAVYNFIVGKGYKVATQVGCSGYRIDMAISHPTLDGRFVLGIECDGATYHSARTARERDRLRQTVLEDIGWKIYRIWSTDWIKDPISEGQKLIDAIKAAILEYIDEGSDINIRNIESEIKLPNLDTKSLVVEASKKPSDEFVNKFNPYNFAFYHETNVREIIRLPDENDYAFVAKIIRTVVKNEYPIYSEGLYQRLACLFGNRKTTDSIRFYIADVVNKVLYDEIEIRNGFYWPKGEQKVIVRIPFGGEGERLISIISLEEIAEALYIIAGKSFGILEKDLYVTTSRVFGFNRTGKVITEQLENACKYLIDAGRVINSEGKIIAQ
jgi:very-short-patch-repair endonuclease